MSDEHPEATHVAAGHPKHTGRFWFDFAAASAAIFISVVSLVVAISGENTQRELLAANSWPFLQGDRLRNVSAIGVDAIRVRNEGVGPAKVYSFEVFYDGHSVTGPEDLLHACCGLSTDPAMRRHQLPEGLSDGDVANNVIRASEELTMIGLKRPATQSDVFDRFDQAVNRITFRTCYCSILNRCWVSDLESLTPTQMPRCAPAAHPWRSLQ